MIDFSVHPSQRVEGALFLDSGGLLSPKANWNKKWRLAESPAVAYEMSKQLTVQGGEEALSIIGTTCFAAPGF